MPDGAVLAERRSSAEGAVDAWLRANSADVRRLRPDELSSLRTKPVAGWRLPVELADAVRLVDVLVGAGFPFDPPRIRLVDEPKFGAWPNVERDGYLCLASGTTTFSPDDPVGMVANVLALALGVGHLVGTPAGDEVHREDILSYWSATRTLGGVRVLSLLDPELGSRWVRAWKGRHLLLAEDDGTIERWRRNLYGKPSRRDGETGPAFLLRLDRPLVPAEMPETAADVLALAEQAGCDKLLRETLSALPDALPVAIAMPSTAGTAITLVVVRRPDVERGRDPLTAGFRPDRVPRALAVGRYFGATSARRIRAQRADPSWIHGRDGDPRLRRLRDSHVVVLGCGSVGAPVAVLLAQAGVGRLTLVDMDVLKAANVGRHPLGMGEVDLPKSMALAVKLGRDLPHLDVSYEVARAGDILRQQEDLLLGCDLIVSAMGDWPAEAMLDEWHQAVGTAAPPVVYGWTEAHAVAGHAVCIAPGGAPFRAGLDETGLPLLRVSEWPGGPTSRREPACGTAYEPYGPIELAPIVTLVAERALDALLAPPLVSDHRVAVSSENRLAAAGGARTQNWQVVVGNGSGVRGTFEFGWPKHVDDTTEPISPRAAAL
ncbi:ThiF family adenylyltransferase [Aureimonas pseudogalii]|uniref:THIF-type NAD/FAD binding fold domain-containing protein n=1 Tax=Aureimonas pseudogalii TaxID=1744844 RepID=A0A7W6H5V9_9HYPH|nr:ThiF family adenylyltransferase [Aureimonas pseudogalii]MBB3999096.1 hypothetical protein [Aureimonas pseudogalii]